jgi:hypothetical protein
MAISEFLDCEHRARSTRPVIWGGTRIQVRAGDIVFPLAERRTGNMTPAGMRRYLRRVRAADFQRAGVRKIQSAMTRSRVVCHNPGAGEKNSPFRMARETWSNAVTCRIAGLAPRSIARATLAVDERLVRRMFLDCCFTGRNVTKTGFVTNKILTA